MPPKTQSKDLKEILNTIQECVSTIKEILDRQRLNRRTASLRTRRNSTCAPTVAQPVPPTSAHTGLHSVQLAAP